jgi:hypothetical protein
MEFWVHGSIDSIAISGSSVVELRADEFATILEGDLRGNIRPS